jgi:hypothetical protein
MHENKKFYFILFFIFFTIIFFDENQVFNTRFVSLRYKNTNQILSKTQ